MNQYMGYRAKEPEQRPQRLLPQHEIEGTLFHVDIGKLEFRQVDRPENRMPIMGAKEEMGFSHFFFDTRTKNLYAGSTDKPAAIPLHVTLVLLPPLKDLDPVGLARKHGLPDDHYQNKRHHRNEIVSVSRIRRPEQTHQTESRRNKGQRV